MIPLVGESKHPIRFNSVVFPEPEGPIIEVHAPLFIETVILLIGRVSLSYDLVRFINLIISLVMIYSPLNTIAGSTFIALLTGKALARSAIPTEIPSAIGIISNRGVIDVPNTPNPIN